MMDNLMVLEDTLVNQLLFKVSGKVVKFMELLLWFKIIMLHPTIKKNLVFAYFQPAMLLSKAYQLLELGKKMSTRVRLSLTNIAHSSDPLIHS